jgi:dihydroorotate dehydrogenase
LIQLYTGWIYAGPGLVPTILEGLQQQLDRHGCRHIGEAVGSGLPFLRN